MILEPHYCHRCDMWHIKHRDLAFENLKKENGELKHENKDLKNKLFVMKYKLSEALKQK